METRHEIEASLEKIKDSIKFSSTDELVDMNKHLIMAKKEIQKIQNNILKVLEVSKYKKIEANKVIEIIAKDFGLSVIELKSRVNKKPNVSLAKKICYQILHIEFRLSIRSISNKIFGYKYHNGVGVAIREYKKLNDKLKADREHIELYESLKTKIKKTIIK